VYNFYPDTLRRFVFLVFLVGLTTMGAIPACAFGQIFVTSITGGTIGEYSFSGTAINSTLISGLDNPHGLALSGNDLFVVIRNTGIVAEYTTAGATVNATLITGFTTPSDITVSGNYLYVTDDGTNTVGKFTTAGQVVNATLVSGLSSPTGVAVSGNVLYVVNNGQNTIGEYDATTGAVINASLISGLKDPFGIVLVGSNLFVANRNNSTIGEYNATTGAAVNVPLVTGLALPFGLAADGSDLYVATTTNHQVGAYTTNGTTVNASFITGLRDPFGIAAAPFAPIVATQPVIAEVIVGNSASFTVFANSEPAPTYQWQVSTDAGSTWTNASGGPYTGDTTTTLTIISPTAAQLGSLYRATATNSLGSANTTAAPLVVGTSSAQLTWLQNNFTAIQLGNVNLVGATAKPAGDGIPNFIKYAFDLNPNVNGQSFLPQPMVSNGNLALTFTIPPPDVSYLVEASTDLVNWSTTGVNIQINGNQATASYSLSGSTQAFLRIVVSPGP
jgi:hypothetical protein